MIISCPSCAARYVFSDNKLRGEGMALTCETCGHRWVESGAMKMIDVSPRTTVIEIDQHGLESEQEIKRLMEASLAARAEFKARRQQRLKNLRNWGILAACMILPISAAAAFPMVVVKLAPITVKAYEKIGYTVNIYGLEVRRVEQQHAILDGARVLTIKGEVYNLSNQPQKLPWLLFNLRDVDNQKLYTWTLDTNARPLKPGESVSFTSRVASPPETAKNLEIRFAHGDEIGLNPKP